MASHLSCRANVASSTPLRASVSRSSVAAAAPLRIECAISRAKKEEIVGKLRSQMDNSMLVFGMRFTEMPVRQMEGLRRKLPSDASMYVAKNSLMRVAVSDEAYERFRPIEQTTTLDNVWIFAPEESVAETVKGLKSAQTAIAKTYKAAGNKGPTAAFSGGVFDGQYLTEEEILKLETMPTKKDLYTKIALSIKAVPTKTARSIKAVPQKLAVAIKELADMENEDRSALVGDVFPKNS